MLKRMFVLPALLLMVPVLAGAATGDPVRSCASLKLLSLPNVTITAAEPVAAGMFVPPDLKPDEKVPALYRSAPAFCRVVATLTPSADSDIKAEFWMPAGGWNGRFRGQGNGGFAGHVTYGGLAAAVIEGYASASTDTGHSTPGAEWALGHPEKIVDYGFRAIHEMTLDAKTIAQAFYGAPPKQAYFASCSNGGRQALMEVQRFPKDYDGVIAGAPANAWVPMLTAGLKYVQTLDRAGYIPPAKVPSIGEAVLAACDKLDGLADGILNDPRQCHFDPAVLLCKAAESDACLTAPQVDSLKTIYSGAREASGKLIFPPLLPGAEEGDGGWEAWVTGSEEGKSAATFFVTGYFADMVYGNKDWDFRSANLDRSLKLAYQKTGDAVDAMNPEIKPFLAHGGKLILYHGWNDPAIAALNTIHYHNNLVSTVGRENVARSVRLYMVPGMQHCAGGPGASWFGQGAEMPRGDAEHDIFGSLVAWVEKDKTPDTIIATKYQDDDSEKPVEITRPVCPYPRTATYKGIGDPRRAESFVCEGSNSISARVK